ncbi:MAG: hypothetical protein ACLFNL_07995 [Bacteroidales bacterium]
MHLIEPHYSWRDVYISENDQNSPFFGREYSEFYFTNTIYDHYIHPQWDYFGSDTLFLKIIYADYSFGFTIIELLGEWNDCLYNDIMFFKRNVIEPLLNKGIDKFILIGENIFNFHVSDDSYYEEWFEELGDGWIVALNFRDHVKQEFFSEQLDNFIYMGGNFDTYIDWRSYKPYRLFTKIKDQLIRRLQQ